MAQILIIDDEINLRLVLKEVLTDAGHEVLTANDGKTGMKLLEEGYKPELILIDLYMPKMNGREFVIQLRDKMELLIPVILITGSLPNGKDFPPGGSYQDIIGKPFDIDDVLASVNRLIVEI